MLTFIFLVVVLLAIVLVARAAFAPKRSAITMPRAIPDPPQGFSRPTSQDGPDALADLATCARPRGYSDLTAVVQVRIADDARADWHLDFVGGQCTLTQGTAEGAPVTVSAKAQAWRELAAKRVSFAGAYMNGTIQVEGDNAIVMRLDDALSGPVDSSRRMVAGPGTPAVVAPPLSSSPDGGEQVAGDDLVTPSTAGLPNQAQANASAVDLRAAVQEALKNLPPNATREQKMEAIRSVLASHGGLEGLSLMTSRAQFSGQLQNVLAIRAALANLPPGATAEQKRAALRAAIGQGGSGQEAAGSHEGIGAHLGGAMFEGIAEAVLEGLVGGE
jgi:hypothetical protein